MTKHSLTAIIQLSDVEDALIQQGHFCLLDWLLDRNHLAYADYEKWRYGESDTLDKLLNIQKSELKDIVETINTLGSELNLQQQPQDYYTWSQTERRLLAASRQAKLHQELTQHWMRPQDLPQMDLFMDNSAVVTENTLLDSLCAREFDHAQKQLQQLTELNSKHEKLGHYQDLINYGYHMNNSPLLPEHIQSELVALEDEVVPLAKALLKHQARDYLAFAWRRLYQNLQGQSFNPAQEKLHSSYVLMQIPDWEAAAKSLEDEKEQYQQAILLQRTAQCSEIFKEDHKAILCWCLFMETDEEACEAAIETKVSPMIWELWQNFWEENENAPRTFFPAYLFTQRPGIVHHLESLPQLQSPATTAVIEGIRARLLKQNKIPARKKMKDISPALLNLFMLTETEG